MDNRTRHIFSHSNSFFSVTRSAGEAEVGGGDRALSDEVESVLGESCTDPPALRINYEDLLK
jgi:hypothetical protein